ncbi:hypothetical protein ESA_03318 [Cronobacter sakazakii ATCC BAA-894]|uniref:Uncharacterized protein n=1 Tax=Cronobacter sakazakii (strain ATCC BAA-894) TaxID=290339 RepID=A7MIL3_CROS8|nr:hypothetical protein ESA_03318 [Cronobacter sakazakii ATCC BAA-894]
MFVLLKALFKSLLFFKIIFIGCDWRNRNWPIMIVSAESTALTFHEGK